MLGHCQFLAKKYEEAKDTYLKAIRLAPYLKCEIPD